MTGNLLEGRVVGHFPAQGGDHLVILFLESQGGGILRVHFQNAVDLRVGFPQITLTLRLPGQFQSHGHKS